MFAHDIDTDAATLPLLIDDRIEGEKEREEKKRKEMHM